jgi:L-amino acid N-acyltransferase YncA
VFVLSIEVLGTSTESLQQGPPAAMLPRGWELWQRPPKENRLSRHWDAIVMNVRLAELKDAALFITLWRKFLRELRATGGDILPTNRTMSFFADLFNAYVSRQMKGVIVLADDHSVLMWGETKRYVDSINDPFVLGFGTYVDPEHRQKGICRLMRKKAIEVCKDLGMKGVIGEVHSKNDVGLSASLADGFEPMATRGILRLE